MANFAWNAQMIEKIKKDTKNFPTKALIGAAFELYLEQQRRLDSQKGKLDGMAWSPSEWDG